MAERGKRGTRRVLVKSIVEGLLRIYRLEAERSESRDVLDTFWVFDER